MYFCVSKPFYINKLVTTTHYPTYTYLHISHINISLQRFDLSPLRRLPGTPRAVGTFHGAFVDWTEGQLESGRNPSRDPRWMIRDVWRYKIISYVYSKWWYDRIKLSGKEMKIAVLWRWAMNFMNIYNSLCVCVPQIHFHKYKLNHTLHHSLTTLRFCTCRS